MKGSFLSRMLRVRTLLILAGIALLVFLADFLPYFYLCYQLRFQKYGDVSRLPFLLEHLESDEPGVRGSAAGGISTIGPAAKWCTPKLIEALNDEDTMVIWSVALALGHV